MFKKLLLGLGVTSLLTVAGFATMNTVHAQGEFNQGGFGTTTDAGGIAGVTDDAGTSKAGGLVGVIKSFINWMLGILSLIALVMLLLGGFKMVTAAGDETKYKDGFKVMKQAGIGLAVIGLSWFVVSIIFWLIRGTTQGQ